MASFNSNGAFSKLNRMPVGRRPLKQWLASALILCLACLGTTAPGMAQATENSSPEVTLRKYAPAALRGNREALREAAKAISKLGPRSFRSATEMRARLRVEALMGSSSAANAYGMMLQYGIGGPARPAEAPAWYARGGSRGNISASKNGALAYALGWGVRRDTAKANMLLAQVPADQRARKMLQISKEMLKPGVEEPEAALVWAQKADALDANGSLDSADVYMKIAELSPQLDEQMRTRLQALVAKGNGRAALVLGRWLERAGTPDDKVAAAKYYFLAAEQDELEAFDALGKLLGAVPEDTSQEILAFLRGQADAGVTNARVVLGNFYFFQSAIAGDMRSRGMDYLRSAANDGDPQTQYRLAMMLLGNPVDTTQHELARAYLVLAAESGYEQAEIAVGQLGGVSAEKALEIVEAQSQ